MSLVNTVDMRKVMELNRRVFCPILIPVSGYVAFCLLDNLTIYFERIMVCVCTTDYSVQLGFLFFYVVLTKGN